MFFRKINQILYTVNYDILVGLVYQSTSKFFAQNSVFDLYSRYKSTP